MNEEMIKVCSQCGAEYSLKAEICADCGGELVSPEEYDKRFVPVTEDEEQTFIREGPMDFIKQLAEHMKKHGIRAAVRPHGCGPGSCASATRFGLYVTPADESAAKDIHRAFWLQGAPEDASSFAYAEQELQGSCPACSSKIPQGATECPECGLVVAAEEDVAVCPDCGAEVGDEVPRCPKCGAEFE